MKMRQLVGSLLCAVATAGVVHAQTPTVDISLDVFPSILASPNGGGTWSLFAKTNSPNGIAAIDAILLNVNSAGVVFESDINEITGITPVLAGPPVEILYGQDTSAAGVVVGVGTLSKSDGPDPLGNPFWNDATKIFSGTYSATLPIFATKGANSTAANVLATSSPPFNNSIAASITTVVRVAGVPEPATIALACTVGAGLLAFRRCS